MGFLRQIILICFLSGSVFGATYYVSPTGTTAWPNCTSFSSPCLADSTTTGKAFLGATAGDTVIFSSGTYFPGDSIGDPYPAWNPTQSGSSGQQIIFQCQTPGTCILIANSEGPVMGAYNKNYITWDGFISTAVARAPGVYYYDSAHSVVKNCILYGFDNTTDNNGTISLHNADNALVQNNYITMTGASGSGILLGWSDDCIIEKNTIVATTGVNGTGYDGINFKWGGDRNIVRYNFINGNNSVTTIGVIKANNGMATGATGNEVYQNVIINAGNGAVYVEGDTYTELDYKIYNNTFYNNGPTSGNNFGFNNVANQQIWNNIITSSSASNVYTFMDYANGGDGTATYMDYNIYYVVQRFLIHMYEAGQTIYSTLASYNTTALLIDGVTHPDTYSYYEDPVFANAGGSLPTDYKSSATHKNNGRGGSYASVIGAYITGNEQIGYLAPTYTTTTLTGSQLIGGGQTR
jgi:hypothetical protein